MGGKKMINTKKNTRHNLSRAMKKETRVLSMFIIPAAVLVFLFNYVPMFGLIMAFKDFNPNLGILGSKWNGLENFKFFFQSQDAFQITRNTVLYGFTFQITSIFFAVCLALLMYEVKRRLACKIYQTMFIIPNFLSWVLVAYIVYALLNPSLGVVNKVLEVFGREGIDWYSKTEAWPFILTICNTWKHIGMNSIIYYAALMGIDNALYEAARMDGANKFQEIIHITIPELTSVIIIVFILGMGNIIKGDFGLFYQVPKDVGILYPATDIIDTYVYRGLQGGNLSVSAAVGLFQSVVGLILVVATNAIVKKIDSEKSMF